MRHFSLMVLGGMVLGACGGGGDGGNGPTLDNVTVSAGNNQVGAAGTALAESLTVLATDVNGAPMQGVTITFAVTAGGGSVSPGSRATDAAGIARTRFTLGPNAGTQTASGSAGGHTAQFSAFSQINGAVNIANQTTPSATDTVLSTKAESLTVLVTNQSSNPVQGVTVTWASPNGTVSPTSSITNAAGLAKARYAYGATPLNQTATATVTGLVGSPVTITLPATAGVAVAIVKTGGDNTTAAPGTQVTYTVQSQDSHGNPKGGVTIDWAAATGGGSITPTQTVTAANNGNASAQRTLGAGTGAQTATAIAAGLTPPDTVTFTTTAAIVTTVTVSNNNFNPDSIMVPKNSTVTYSWNGTTVLHNVTFAAVTGAPADIANRTSGSQNRTFDTAGTFNYSCTNHIGMNGKVVVTP